MKKEVVDFLTENTEDPSSIFADLTFGGGGHSLALLAKGNDFKVFSTDQDPDAIANSEKIIKENSLEERLKLIKINFSEFPDHVSNEKPELHEKIQGIVMDLGVSSHHFDDFSRGFSFRGDAYLDMRMAFDNDDVQTAAELINECDKEELVFILREYGEERFADRIAENIIQERSKQKISTTKELENIAFHAYPKKMRHGRTHPATKTFQAFRIAVNNELNVLMDVIPKLYSLLKPSGRIAIITFHSLEDRIVKRAFKKLSQVEKGILLTKKPLYPSEEEIKDNSRSRSAKLRVIEKLSV